MNHDCPDPDLAAPLAALRSASAACSTPARVEQALMAAFAAQFAPRRWYQRLSPAQWGLAGSAMAATLALLVLRAPLPGAGQAPLLDDGLAFIALASQERIEQEPSPRMVETSLPRTELAALGVPVSPDTAGDSVRAEMLVGADGAPLALRLSSQ
ncbi:hypothetical protein LXA47_23040 [Massilia sp. P8910]|uniref:Uncharacterized protein n=1 Tax=Massilia antarctica TaxID=2765360 RepID=A0AA48WI12_9BURK|nr:MULTISPECIES: hypothetical protein [Massilia]CUI07098.1 hypothetical protein BN2497_8973 [Janthinobacterium sp. CG23_2]MCE3606460.1 hypothetical protein [Massilia antarctica]MCY0915120.1 hypothetical protein [Massilia sp. H27-R4]QPI52108.1 hypothetical protein IV454_11750 [Massilia antarctica]CUU30884.1 hypothetical protein BN3177_8973 [Janthinobacterium sp. CG23_2]